MVYLISIINLCVEVQLMKYFIRKMRAKIYCIKIKHDCNNCKYCANGHDFWGCIYFF